MRVSGLVAAVLSVAAVAEASTAHGPRRLDNTHHDKREPEPLLLGLIKGLTGQAASIAATPIASASANAAAATAAAGGTPVIAPSAIDLPRINSNTGTADLSQIMTKISAYFKALGQAPVVTLPQGSYNGVRSPPMFQQEWFFGIPFAAKQSPATRFMAPSKPPASTDTFNATQIANACPQPNNYLINFNTGTPRGEDCLTVNVWSPVGASAGNMGKLPVLFWLYGGGEIGNAHNVYNSSALVLQSILQFQPMIVITPNYRGNSFGFLAGKKITQMARAKTPGGPVLNPGLLDVTAALEWTRDNIAAFGGDPAKITLAGQSSGAFNVGAQMLKDGANKGVKPIYRAAVMLSGTPSTEPAPEPDSDFADENFRRICGAVGCNADADDVITCLRNVDAIRLGEATFFPAPSGDDGSNPSLYWILGPKFYAGNQPFQPTRDGIYHRYGAAAQIRAGDWPDVPLLTGNVRDEGTIFVSQSTNAAGIKDNLKTIGFTQPNAPGVDGLVDQILTAYPDVPKNGAPYLPGYTADVSRFGAGNQFERLASILGDFAFQSKRRFLLNRYVGGDGMTKLNSPVWSYLFNETYAPQPADDRFGIPHGYDPGFWFAGLNFAPNFAYLNGASAGLQASKSFVAFVNKMNPNAFGNPYWAPYTDSNRRLMVIKGWATTIADNYRPQMNLFSSIQATTLTNN